LHAFQASYPRNPQEMVGRIPFGRWHPVVILLIPRFLREIGRARFPLLFPQRAGPDRGLREYSSARARRGSGQVTRPAAPAPRTQGNRDLGRTEPTISRQEKVRAV